MDDQITGIKIIRPDRFRSISGGIGLQIVAGMNRREIPLIEMIDYGQEHLRRKGFVVMSFVDSFTRDPNRLSPHYHDFYQVSLLSGPCRLMHDFRETDSTGDTLFFLSPGQVHTVRPGQGVNGTIVSFTRGFFEGSPDLLLDMPFFYPAHSLPWLPLEEDAVQPARDLFGELQEEFDAARPFAEEVLRSLLRILFVKATRWQKSGENEIQSTRGSAMIRRFHQEVEQHFRDWQTLAPYARLLGVSVNHLNDVIKDGTGISAGEHVRTRRLLDAKRLLLHSGLSVSEIGYQLGFKDPSYFSRFFRRYEEATPAVFRSRIREKYQKEAE